MVSGEHVPIRGSPDAVVGALVHILKTAAPLQQDLQNSVTSSHAVNEEAWNQRIHHAGDVKVDTASGSMITASGFFKSRTAADALEELRRYKEIKELLLKQDGSVSLDVLQEENVYPVGETGSKDSLEF